MVLTEVRSLFLPKHLRSGIVRVRALLSSVGSSGPPCLLSSTIQPAEVSLVALSVVEGKGQWQEAEQSRRVVRLSCFEVFLLFLFSVSYPVSFLWQ